MEKIKRTDKRSRTSGWSVFFKILFVIATSAVMVIIGYFAALFISNLFS